VPTSRKAKLRLAEETGLRGKGCWEPCRPRQASRPSVNTGDAAGEPDEVGRDTEACMIQVLAVDSPCARTNRFLEMKLSEALNEAETLLEHRAGARLNLQRHGGT